MARISGVTLIISLRNPKQERPQMYIKNAAELIENGETEAARRARRLSLEAVEAALAAVEPGRLIKSKLSVRGGQLFVQDISLELARFRRILVIGGGKAGGPMARALDSVLGDRITAGIINVPDSKTSGGDGLGKIKLHRATHPLPSRAGIIVFRPAIWHTPRLCWPMHKQAW